MSGGMIMIIILVDHDTQMMIFLLAVGGACVVVSLTVPIPRVDGWEPLRNAWDNPDLGVSQSRDRSQMVGLLL